MAHPLELTAHRPWPLPSGPWVMTQTWYDLLFAHWSLPVEALRRVVPASLELDTFDGQGWVGVVPFGMTRVYPRLTFPVPWLSHFLELNVRTYVRVRDKPGVYFLSLDAANPVAVEVARALFKLPYYNARMTLDHRRDGWLDYHSFRTHLRAAPAEFKGRYRPTGEVYFSQPGTLEHWLTERYCLYSVDRRGRIFRGEIHHGQWPLQPAEAEFSANSMTLPHGLTLPNTPPLLHFAKWIETYEWLIQPVD